MQKISFFLMAFLVSIGTLAFGQDSELYVKSKYAEIRKNPVRKSGEDAMVPRGTGLKELKYKKKWYYVSFENEGDSGTGWIYTGRVTSDKEEIASDPSLTTKGGSNALAADDLAAGRAMRGVGPLAQKFSKSNSITQYHQDCVDYHQSYVSVEKGFEPIITGRGIQTVKISFQDIQKFLQEGQLGEFAELQE